MRRTKIVCTIGPASSTPQILEDMIRAGMNIARFNFSHGTHEKHAELIRSVREVAGALNQPVALLQDLQGPKIRVGEFADRGILLKKGQRVTVTTRPVKGNDKVIPVNYPFLHEDVKPGDHLLLDDGLIDLRVEKVEGQDILCRVVVGGPLSSHKGVNLPGIPVRLSSLSEKDREDLRFGLEQGVDLVALSFVRTADDVRELRREMEKNGRQVPIVAKIEKPEAWRNINEIIEEADAIMVARGDLGVEMGPEKVPTIQKEIIARCIRARKPVITATQMLESMRNNPRPTRAEASDVANAIFDGTDAVMLSSETSIGNYPVESVRMMARIAKQAENYLLRRNKFRAEKLSSVQSFPDAISEAATHAALELRAKAIVAFTQSGFTARLISGYRPAVPIVAFTLTEEIRRQLLLCWGVQPEVIPVIQNIDEMIRRVSEELKKTGYAKPGDTIAVVAGAPIGVRGTTNMLTLHHIS